MITQRLHLTSQDVPLTNPNKLHTLGAIAETEDGRVFRYTQAGAVNLAAGKVTIATAKVANHTAIAVALAAKVGDRQVEVTLAATAATVDQYAGGYLTVVDAAGVGQNLRILTHPAAASAGNLMVQLADPVHTALTTSSKVSLVPNLWSNSIISTASASVVTTGSPVVAVPATYCYWSQTGGVASVLSDGIIAKGAEAIVSASVGGALTTDLAASVTQVVGFAPEATVDTKYYPLYLTVDQG